MLTACDLQRLYDLTHKAAIPDSDTEIAELTERAKAHIATITDPNVRYSMYERYINRLSWDKIADIFSYGSGDAVRKRCKRYINGMMTEAEDNGA